MKAAGLVSNPMEGAVQHFHADAVAMGEADETWPLIVADAARGELKEIYTPTDASGKERKPTLEHYPAIPWDALDLEQFNRIPRFIRPLISWYPQTLPYSLLQT